MSASQSSHTETCVQCIAYTQCIVTSYTVYCVQNKTGNTISTSLTIDSHQIDSHQIHRTHQKLRRTNTWASYENLFYLISSVQAFSTPSTRPPWKWFLQQLRLGTSKLHAKLEYTHYNCERWEVFGLGSMKMDG